MPPARMVRRVPLDRDVEVPRNFVGMHLHRWPGGPSSAPRFPFGVVRSLNYDPRSAGGGIHWNAIERESGRFDWGLLDTWVDTHRRAGRDLVYTLYGTPAWCASRSTPDAYGKPGGDSPPTDLRFVRRFVTALVDRYNGGGSRRIGCIETWNEPTFDGTQTWKGSATELAAIGRALFTSAKAIDPGVRILWPAFVDSLESGEPVPNLFKYTHQAYAKASDGSGGRGRDWADALNFHYYHTGKIPGASNLMDHQDSMLAVRTSLERPGWPIYLSEIGFLDGVGERYTVDEKVSYVQRWAMLSAAYGNAMIGFYSYESVTNLGAPKDEPRIADAIGEMHTRLSGASIVEAGLLEDGSVWVCFADGTTLRR